MRRIARWEALGELHEVREHVDAERWWELHVDESRCFFVRTNSSVWKRLGLGSVSTVAAVRLVLHWYINPMRRYWRIERVV